MYDLKTISGKGSVDSRLSESMGQTNRVVLNISTDYKAGKLARSIIRYFERYGEGIEIVVFRGNKKIAITRQMVTDRNFVVAFSKKYYKYGLSTINDFEFSKSINTYSLRRIKIDRGISINRFSNLIK